MNEEIAKEYLSLIPALFSSFSELSQNSVGLTHLQNHVVEFLYMQKRALNLKDICHGLNIAKQQITNVVKDLEERGYLEKIPDPKDKRAVLVSLTSRGNRIEEEKWQDIYKKFTKNLMKLGEEEQLDLKYALHKVNTLLKKLEDDV